METGSRNGIVDDTEDSDASLLIVNDDDEVLAGASDDDDDANLRIPDAVLSNGTALNPVSEVATELTCPVSAATSSLPSSAHSLSGNVTQDAVVVTQNDVNCSRHRRRRRRHHRSVSGRRRSRLCDLKRKESNYISATCHVIVIVLVCIAMSESRWFYVQGDRCSDARHSPVNYLGIKTFFYQGANSGFVHRNTYYYGNSFHDVLYDCVTRDAVFIMRVMIASCFLVIILSFTAGLMDVLGPAHVICQALRSTASLSVLSACMCIVTTGLSYLVTTQLTRYYSKRRLHATSKVLIKFDVGFYVMTAAGALSVIAVACSLMKRVGTLSGRRRRTSSTRRQVVSDIERMAEIADATRPPAGRTPPPYRR